MGKGGGVGKEGVGIGGDGEMGEGVVGDGRWEKED